MEWILLVFPRCAQWIISFDSKSPWIYAILSETNWRKYYPSRFLYTHQTLAHLYWVKNRHSTSFKWLKNTLLWVYAFPSVHFSNIRLICSQAESDCINRNSFVYKNAEICRNKLHRIKNYGFEHLFCYITELFACAAKIRPREVGMLTGN